MSNICIVASCDTRRTPNTDKTTAIKCFSFPKDPELRRQWLHLCQVNEDYNRKVCIKHFKEDDFVDGLKARLMCVQPTRLKKDAVPSLFLSPDIITEESKQMHIQNQEEMHKKYIGKKKRQVRVSTAKSKDKINNPTKGSMEYLSKLVPIAPKGQGVKRGTIVGPKTLLTSNESLAPQWQKISVKESISEESIKVGRDDSTSQSNNFSSLTTDMKTLKPDLQQNNIIKAVHTGYSLHQLKILQHDNTIYKKRINTLVDSQNKLRAQIKELEAKIQSQKEDFVGKVKETFTHVLTSNQIDNILGKKKHIWWTKDEYSKALKLLHISKQAYKYIKDKLNYPLPCISNVYKWSTKHELALPEKQQKCDENKENGGKGVIDHMSDDDQMIDGDNLKREIKSEYNEVENAVNIEYNLDIDKEYTIKVNNVKDDIECEKVDYVDNDDHNVNDSDIVDNIIDIDHPIVVNQYIDNDTFEIDNINGHDSDMNDNDQNDEFYEELIIDYNYSDDEMFDLQKDECEKDNG